MPKPHALTYGAWRKSTLILNPSFSSINVVYIRKGVGSASSG